MRPYNERRNPSHNIRHFTWIIATLLLLRIIEAKFEPYQNNGGLLTAVAGRDYVLLASDTRLSDGYEIKSRSFLSSRIWNVSPHSSTIPGEDAPEIFEGDGSINIPPISSSFMTTDDIENSQSSNHEGAFLSKRDYNKSSNIPIFIGSSGCVADCIGLQRQLRSELSAYTYWTGGRSTIQDLQSTHLTPRQVSVLLMNTLYSRRSFPFYAFCVIAGLNSIKQCSMTDDVIGDDSHGAVYVYDAIGSNERVSVAAVGTGSQMMQPILDRLFANSDFSEPETNLDHTNDDIEGSDMSDDLLSERDGNAVAAWKQKKGNTLLPPVQTCVSCNCEEAIDLVMRGYRSVAEREIGVGDDVVVCVLKRKMDGGHSLEVRRFPLRKH